MSEHELREAVLLEYHNGSNMVSAGRVIGMNITLKNIPEPVYDSLKRAAEVHHRSLNSEIIACLEQVLLPVRVSPEQRLARARQLRMGLSGQSFDSADIAAAIAEGRP